MMFILAPILYFSLMSDAHAYLDGGTGGMILQAILGGVAAGLFFLKSYWYKLLAFFGKKSSKKNEK